VSACFYDVVVCGGGPSGVAAAVASARAGMRTLLIERYGFAGGMATSALVNPFAGHQFFTSQGQPASLIGGIFSEIVKQLDARGAWGTRLTYAAFDEEILKSIYDGMLADASVDVLYHSLVTDVNCNADRIVSVAVQSKSGMQTIRGNVFVDATGDGDLAVMTGCAYVLGRPLDHAMQPATMSFRMAGVDKSFLKDASNIREAREPIDAAFKLACQSGALAYPWRDFMHFYDYPRADVLHFNMTRMFDVNGTIASDMTRAEMEGRMQVYRLADWLIANVPCFKHAYVSKLACQVGVRETRHVKGHYQMTAEDIVQGRKFVDGIVRSAYFIDIHSPTGSGFDHEVKNSNGLVAHRFKPPLHDWYEVPYRAVVPIGIANLLLPCRALSATHEAAAAVRVMATMTGIGQACGIAASQAIENQCDCIAIDTLQVRQTLGYLDQAPDLNPIWGARFLQKTCDAPAGV
jgi:hypothetical protein